MDILFEQIKNDLILNTFYDIIKFSISFLIVRTLYDTVYQKWRWGNWQIVVNRGKDELARRNIAPARARMIHEDETDLSIYIKGVVSFHDRLKVDVCSTEAKSSKLLTIDKGRREITVDLANNQPNKGKDWEGKAELNNCIGNP